MSIRALDNNHEIVRGPEARSICPPQRPDRGQRQQIEGRDASSTPPTAVMISAKTGLGVPDVLEAIVKAPAGRRRATATRP